MSKLHIILAVVNCLDLTKQALDSVVTKEQYSVHIVDQASTDGTREWAEQMHDTNEQRSNGKLFYHRYDKQVALSEAWNRGITESLADPECEYLFIPNNDVVFHKNTIDVLIEYLEKFNYAMVTGENVQPRMSLETMQGRDDWGDIEFDSKPIGSWMEEGPDFSCFMVKRDFVEKIGYFDENFFPAYCEDQDMHIRIIKAGDHAKRMTRAPYYHLASQTMAKNAHLTAMISEGHHRNQLYYREKWGVDHAEALNGKGFATPYNQPDKNHKYWKGSEKYDRQSTN